MKHVADRSYIQELIASRQEGHSLPRPFYREEAVYQAELERIWRHGWLFVGFGCQIPGPGDFFTLDLDTDPIIVVRDEDRVVHAFHNICRHRGTVLCDSASGKTKRFICPYHQWTYGLQGQLLSCRGMQEDLDKNELGLHHVHVREVAGMIFVSFACHPPDFRPAAELLGRFAQPQGFESAKVAKMVDYDVAANWKIVWENNRECYHCNVNHPQYIKANFDHYSEDDMSDRIRNQMTAGIERSELRQEATGVVVTHREHGIAPFPDADRDLWYSANRTLLVDGYVSESLDGQQVAPLMGDYVDTDVGTLRMRTMPNMWNHSSCDHAVTTRLLPAGRERTLIRVIWLVDAGAIEGQDYHLETLLPFWKMTSEQDWELCERAQRGINSSHYRPGPFSTSKEYNVDAFVRWYLAKLTKES